MGELFRGFGPLIIYGVVMLMLIGGVWGGSLWLGRRIETQVTHHEMEQAHCYTAGKMFFVSIACVPKEK
jgi:hypothetical protein